MNSLAPALAALAIVTSASVAASSAEGARPAAIEPAPPPATYCHLTPPTAWPLIDANAVGDLTPYQDYRSGLAIDPGLSGSGLRIADVEYEWSASHVDLVSHGLRPALPTPLDPAFQARDHGTAVLGILGAADDGQGITGLAPAATLAPLSPFSSDASAVYQPAQAIRDAAKGLRRGDVMLVELQAFVVRPSEPTVLGPIEYYPEVRTAIRKAVNDGIVVVEPAGNGDLDIGTLGRPWLSDPQVSNSGAILVGAGGSGLGTPATGDRERVPGSNYGARVDLQGFGAAVVTAGYADLTAPGGGPDRAYTACFDGTSSASATVAGGIAVLQSAVVARGGAPLRPAEVRDFLVATGLAQVPALADEGLGAPNIGPRPQIAAALVALASRPESPPPANPDDAGRTPAAGSTPSTATSGGAIPAPFVPGGLSVPAGRITSAPAVRGISVALRRRTRTLVLHLRGAAPSVSATVGRHSVRIDHGRVVLHGVSPGRLVIRVRAPAGARTVYRDVRFRITIPWTSPVRVTRF